MNALIGLGGQLYKSQCLDIVMSLIKSEMDKEFSALSFRSQRRNLRVLKQVGQTTKDIDESRKALMPGKRISKSGKIYWETRKNRSDAKGSKV